MTKSNDRIPETGYWQRNARDILSAIEAPSERKERLPRYEMVDPMARKEPIVTKEKNAVTDPDSWLNRGLGTILENAVEAVLGEGTGNAGLDMALGLTGPGAAVGTVAAGNRPGVLDMLPGGTVMKAGLLGLIRGGKKTEAKAIYDILQNPIANRFANRYPEEALQSLEKFVKKHPSLKTMNTAEVYDVMQSGRLGGEWFVDLGKEYPEALNTLFNPDRKIHEHQGVKYNVWDIIDRVENVYGNGYANPLREGVELVNSDIARGDYLSAWDKMGTLQKTIATIQGYGRYLDQTPQALADFAKDLNEQLTSRVRARKPGEEYVRALLKAGEEGKYNANLVDEYLHLQTDPVDWSRIADIDDKMADDIAQYGSVRAAEKALRAEQTRLAMERKAASEAAKESRQYEQRLRDFKKNPKKALKTANSAAPKQVRSQGDAAIREWYFGVDPLAPKTVEVSPAQEIMKTAPEPVPEPVVSAPPPEPVAPVVQEIQEAPVVVPEPPKGGPNKWRENGWVSSEHPLSNGLTYNELVGRNASEEDRRASFVLDSLMNEAVGKLYATGAKWGSDGKFYKKGNVPPGVKTVEPSYADYRHKGTNYDAVRLGLARDLERNAITGNMPVSSKVILEQAYNKRTGNRIPGAKVLRINGMDTYENLFRPRVKDKLAELEEYYNVEFMR